MRRNGPSGTDADGTGEYDTQGTGGDDADGERPGDEERPGDDRHDRLPDAAVVDSWNRLAHWVLLSGDRMRVAVALTCLVFVGIVGFVAAGLVPLAETQPVYYGLGGLVSGNLTLITVVVSINQLLLSRELKSPGQLESQIDRVIDYRREVEDAAGRVAPVEPLGFLRLLVENTRSEAQALGGLAYDRECEDLEDEIRDLVEAVTSHVDSVDRLLKASDASTFQVLSVTLTTNYARHIHQIRRLREYHGDRLPDDVMASLDDLVDRLQEIDVARQYFKTVYLEQELSSMSRVLLYAGLPAEFACVAALLLFTAREGATFPTAHPAVVLSVVLTLGFVPLAILCAYILRTATVTRRTAATIPFTTPEQESE